MAVVSATNRNAIIARRGLNPDVVESGLPHDPPVGHAIEGNATGHAQVLGASCFTQPDRALEEQSLRVVLNPPGNVFPMLYRWARFPVALVFGPEWFVELRAPLRNVHLFAVDLEQRLDRMGAAVRRQAHHLAALVPVRKNVDRDPAVQRSESRHEVELIAQKSANRFEPDLFQRFNSRAVKPVIT